MIKYWHGGSGGRMEMMNLKEMLKIYCQVSKPDWIKGIREREEPDGSCFQA